MSKRLLAALAAMLMILLTGCSADDEGGDVTAEDPSAQAEDSQEPAAEGDCTYDEAGSASKEVEPPPGEPSETGTVEVTLATNVGDIAATLDGGAAPCTVNSFVSLAEQGYFDDTSCHRLTTEGIFVLQCGDPTGSGMGGPGYQYADELTGDESYGPGTLAMANAGPGTNGSQFFIVYEDSSVLPPNYTVFGSIDEQSLKTVQEVAAKGTDTGGGDGGPKQAVTITGVS